MVPPIPTEHREEIVKLRENGYSFRNIRDTLMQKGVKYSVIGIGNCYQKIVKNGSIDAQPKQKYSKETLERIKQELQSILEENSDLTGQQQIDEIKRRLGVTVSMDAVGRYRRMLGWKVMPIASNKAGGSNGGKSSADSSNGASTSPSNSYPSAATNPDGTAKSEVEMNGEGGSSSDRHHHNQAHHSHQQPSVRTSGYYLHPPDVLLPPELSTVAAALPVLANNNGIVQNAVDQATFRLSEQQLSAVIGGDNGDLESLLAQHNNNGVVKTEYGVASTSNAVSALGPNNNGPPQMHLIHTAQGQILAEMAQQDGVGTPSSSAQLANVVASAGGGVPMNTAIVYPLKQAKFGPMHVFTSRCTIKTGALKYQVWAGISAQGATSICIWDATIRMKSQFYCNTILEKFYLPFCADRYANKRCILVQSNDPTYRSIDTKTYMDQHGICSETWTSQYGAESNPIELIWEEISDHIRSEVKPRTLNELRDAICNFWATKMTDSKCRDCLKKCSIFSEY